jgi:hypothetical protein
MDNKIKYYLCFSDNYPDGIILERAKLFKLRGFKTIVEVDASMIESINTLL